MPDASDLIVLERIRRLARLWDEAVHIPGLGVRVGLDALIGLIPGVGDLVGLLVGCYPLLAAARLGAGPAVLGRMALNLLVDAAIGAIPIAGDLFDVAWRANSRNRDLLEQWATDPRRARRSSRLVVTAVATATAGTVLVAGWLLLRAIAWLSP